MHHTRTLVWSPTQTTYSDIALCTMVIGSAAQCSVCEQWINCIGYDFEQIPENYICKICELVAELAIVLPVVFHK